jgi:hydrogenase maturation factor
MAIVNRLQTAGIHAAVIGDVVTPDRGCLLRSADGTMQPLPVFSRDEVARLFG